MARKRYIKPEASLDEDLAQLSFEARLCFHYLPCHADREGRLEDRPMKISALIFPYDSVDMDSILEQLAMPRQFAGGSFITRYETQDGAKYIQINNFKKHQIPHPNEMQSIIPAPNDKVVTSNYMSLQAIKNSPRSCTRTRTRTRTRSRTEPQSSESENPRSESKEPENKEPEETLVRQGARSTDKLAEEPIPDGVHWDAGNGVNFTTEWRNYLSDYLKRYSKALDEAAKTNLGTCLTEEEAQDVLEYLNERLLTDPRLRATEKSNEAKWKQFRALVRNQFIRALIQKRKRERYQKTNPKRAGPNEPKSWETLKKRIHDRKVQEQKGLSDGNQR